MKSTSVDFVSAHLVLDEGRTESDLSTLFSFSSLFSFFAELISLLVFSGPASQVVVCNACGGYASIHDVLEEIFGGENKTNS